jgi:uncharacterized protein with von Willebrand factor type A (vWA) domain
VAPDRNAVGFVRALRAAGLEVPVGATVTFAEALDAVGFARPSSVYWAGRATLLTRVESVPTYDRVFAEFWHGRTEPEPFITALEEVVLAIEDESGDASESGDAEDDDARPALVVRASAQELLRAKDFALCSTGELDETHRLLADLRFTRALRRSRRLRTIHRHGHTRGARLDVRTTVRRSLRAGGEPVQLRMRGPSTRPRRLVLLVDVSGSMDPYTRALLRFAHAAVASGRRVETFALGTRLTRLTRALSSRDPDEAMARAADAVEDWSGGTRLGEGLRTFNDRWGVRGIARGAVVVILSDGWERDDPSMLAEQMARLRRVAHRIVWVNPLKATDGYEPLARGMAAALPFVDDFVEGHSLESLESLAHLVGAQG